jgi:hypothetical protein
MSSPRGYAGLSGVRITGIYPFHRRSLDHALGVVAGSRVVGSFPKGGKREGEMVVDGYPSRPGGGDYGLGWHGLGR